jgi:hypothetical protein
LLAACAALLIATDRALAAKPRYRVPGAEPRVIRYDITRDDFVRQESIVSSVKRDPPGGRESYMGNRLTQFRYTGKPGTGGIYDALDGYKRELKLDPKKYRYRHRW